MSSAIRSIKNHYQEAMGALQHAYRIYWTVSKRYNEMVAWHSQHVVNGGESHVLVCYADGMEKFKQVLIDSEANFIKLVEKMQEGLIQMDQVEALVAKFRRELKAFEDLAFLLENQFMDSFGMTFANMVL